MKTLLTILTLLLTVPVLAGPPDGGQPRQAQFLLYCHPSENDMILAIAKSFGEHIAITADVGDHMKLLIFLNEEKKTLSIMGTSNESCLVFSASNVEHFERPAYLPKEGDEGT